MARTPLFRQVRSILEQAVFITRNPRLKQAVHEWESGIRNEDLVSRRRFLKTLGITGAALASVSPTGILASETRKLLSGPASTEKVMILGGGIAGLTAAYRLSRSGAQCSIYEAAPRLGGRILTQDKFNAEGMFCELGGELIDTEQYEILGLAAELGVEIDDFVPVDAAMERCHFYFAGRHYHTAEILQAFAPLARHLARDIDSLSDTDEETRITYRSHTADALRLDRLSMKEYLYSMTDVDRWVLDLIHIAYLGEYGEETERQSAINLLMMLSPDTSRGFRIFGSSDESKRIRGGNSRLIEALETAIRPKVAIHLGHELVRISRKNGIFHLTFRQNGGQTITRTAERLVCTIPFSILRQVDGIEKLGLSPVKLRCIRELAYGRNTKHMMGFTERYWRTARNGLPATNGYFFTDLPTQTYWDTSRAQRGQSAILTNFLGGNAAADSRLHVMSAALQDLEKVFPGLARLHDGNQSLFNWGDYRLSRGSYTCPSPGQYTTIIGSPGEDEFGGQLLFAGEHVSEAYQGYMNGAVQSGNRAAEKILAACLATAPHA